MMPTDLSGQSLTVRCSACGDMSSGTCFDGESVEVCGERIRRPHKDACLSRRAWNPAEIRARRKSLWIADQTQRTLACIARNMEEGEPRNFLECFLPRAFRVWLHRRRRSR